MNREVHVPVHVDAEKSAIVADHGCLPGLAVTKFDVGVILNQDTDPAISFAVDQALSMVRDPAIATRCREAAELVYSLEIGTASYEAICDNMRGHVA